MLKAIVLEHIAPAPSKIRPLQILLVCIELGSHHQLLRVVELAALPNSATQLRQQIGAKTTLARPRPCLHQPRVLVSAGDIAGCNTQRDQWQHLARDIDLALVVHRIK
jgi:hypothetical protein